MDEDKDDKQKDDNPKALNSNEITINKIESEEALTDCLTSIIFQLIW